LRDLAERSKAASVFNVEFQCLWLLADIQGCVNLLMASGRNAEAVLFAQTYKPSIAPLCVAAWKSALEKEGKGRVARVIAAPPGTEGCEPDADLFPEWDEYLKIESEGGVKLIDIEGDEEEGDEEVGEVEEEPVEEEEEEEDEEDEAQATPEAD
jgi:coatomer subunit beta'